MANEQLRLSVIQRQIQKPVAMADNPITSHVLDMSSGKPASDLPLTLSRFKEGNWHQISSKLTDGDGRASGFLTQSEFSKGTYKMMFDTGKYFANINVQGFYPIVEVVFAIEKPEEHYHIPLLLSPFGYSTYRGS